jgi:hypothetical protein
MGDESWPAIQFLKDYAKEEWHVIYGAPVASAILAVLAGGSVWIYLSHHYRERFEVFEQRIKLFKEQAEVLKNRSEVIGAKLIEYPPQPAVSVTSNTVPNITGKWSRLDGAIVEVVQTGLDIDASLGGDIPHSAKGNYEVDAKKFLLKTTRTNPRLPEGKQTTVMDEEWTLIDENLLIYNAKGTDGKSELPASYREVGILTKLPDWLT